MTHFAQLYIQFDLLHLHLSIMDHLLNLSLNAFHLSLKRKNKKECYVYKPHVEDHQGRGFRAHLLVVALLFHRDGVVGAVVGFGAQHTDTPLVGSAEQLQQPVVLLAHPVLQHGHRLDQLVNPQGGDSQVGLQVGPAEGGEAHEAGLHSPTLLAHAHVTTDGPSRHAVLPSGPDLLGHFFGEGVLAQLGAGLVRPETLGTADGEAVLPVG